MEIDRSTLILIIKRVEVGGIGGPRAEYAVEQLLPLSLVVASNLCLTAVISMLVMYNDIYTTSYDR